MVGALLDLFAEPGPEAFVRNAKIILQVFAGVDVVSSTFVFAECIRL